jgi:teichuronic acid biosynthesis glycosyltransferase TuaG
MVPVSVIIPFFNDSKGIVRALASIKNQSKVPNEVIIVDDNSEKKELIELNKIIKIFKKKLNIKLIKNKKNLGPGSSRNIGWQEAKNNLIAFLDSDDSWHYKKIEIQYNFMKKNRVDVSCHKSTTNYSGVDHGMQDTLKYFEVKKWKMFLGNQFTTPTVMLKKKIKIRFEENKYYTEDYLLWLTLILNNYKIFLISRTLAYIHKPLLGSGGLSINPVLMRAGEHDTILTLNNNKLISPFFYLVLITLSNIKKYIRKFI